MEKPSGIDFDYDKNEQENMENKDTSFYSFSQMQQNQQEHQPFNQMNTPLKNPQMNMSGLSANTF